MSPIQLSPLQQQHFSQRALTARPPQFVANTPSISQKSTSILFGGDLKPSTFKMLQKWAGNERANMPALHQALYPLKGQRVGMEQMADISAQIPEDTRLQSMLLTREEELKLLQPFIRYEGFVGDADRYTRLQSVYMGDRTENKTAQEYIARRAYGNPDYMARYYLFWTQMMSDPKKKVGGIDILEMVNDPHPWIRWKLADLIPNLPKSKEREAVYRTLLQDDMPYVRGAAATHATEILKDKEEAQQVIRNALADTETRQHAVKGIQHLEDVKEREAQVHLILENNPDIAEQLVALREKIESPDLWQQIVSTMASASGWTALDAIPLMEAGEERDALIMKLATSEYNRSIGYRMQDLPDAEKVRYLKLLAEDEDPKRRIAALSLLGEVKSKRLKASTLKALIQDTDEEVRIKALAYLTVEMSTKSMERTVLQAVQAENPEMRGAAGRALRVITDPVRRLSEFSRLVQDESPKAREGAYAVLDTLEPPEVQPAFFNRALADTSAEVRRVAMHSKNWLEGNDASVNQAIEQLASDPSPQLRMSLPYKIGPRIFEGFEKFINSPYPTLMDEAIHGMDPESTLSWQDIMPSWLLLLQSGADASRLKDTLEGFKEFKAHALKNREHFTQEGQKPLSEAQMTKWLEQSASFILMAVTLAGPEAVKGKFDEKSNKFSEYLQSTQTLGMDPLLGGEVYKTLHTYSRSHRNWEANRFLGFMYGLSTLGKREEGMKILKDIQETRKINLAKIQKEFLKSVGRFSGLSETILNREDIEERLARWNGPYIYTIGSAFNLMEEEEDQKLLTDVIKADLRNTFSAFMRSQRRPWGTANRKTERLFEKNGLNYQNWLGYNRPMTVNHHDRQLEISLWDRDPSEYLFIGSYARTCMALDTRPSEMLDALLSTFAQYAVIRDKNSGEKIGYIRMFWAVPENDKSAKPQLIVDNVAYTHEQEDVNAKDFLQYAKTYAQKYGKSVTGGEEPEILFSKYIHTIPKDEVEERPMRVLGACRKNSYYLFAVNQYQRSDIGKSVTTNVVGSKNI